MDGLVTSGDGWRIPPNPSAPDTPAEDLDWLTERRMPMPLRCFQMGAKLQNGGAKLPRSYIYARRITPGDTFGQFAARVKSAPGWRYFEIDASHAPNITAPESLMKLLLEIVA
jgi:hypothetical protein